MILYQQHHTRYCMIQYRMQHSILEQQHSLFQVDRIWTWSCQASVLQGVCTFVTWFLNQTSSHYFSILHWNHSLKHPPVALQPAGFPLPWSAANLLQHYQEHCTEDCMELYCGSCLWGSTESVGHDQGHFLCGRCKVLAAGSQLIQCSNTVSLHSLPCNCRESGWLVQKWWRTQVNLAMGAPVFDFVSGAQDGWNE